MSPLSEHASSNAKTEYIASYKGFAKKEMSGKDSYFTSSSHIFSLSTSLNVLWLRKASRTDCRLNSIRGHLFDISIDSFVTVAENTAVKIFSVKSYKDLNLCFSILQVDGSIPKSSTIIFGMKGFVFILGIGKTARQRSSKALKRPGQSVDVGGLANPALPSVKT